MTKRLNDKASILTYTSVKIAYFIFWFAGLGYTAFNITSNIQSYFSLVIYSFTAWVFEMMLAKWRSHSIPIRVQYQFKDLFYDKNHTKDIHQLFHREKH